MPGDYMVLELVEDVIDGEFVTEIVQIEEGLATPGQPGQGVPAGGSLNQVLRKASGADYDTEWTEGGASSGLAPWDVLLDYSQQAVVTHDFVVWIATQDITAGTEPGSGDNGWERVGPTEVPGFPLYFTGDNGDSVITKHGLRFNGDTGKYEAFSSENDLDFFTADHDGTKVLFEGFPIVQMGKTAFRADQFAADGHTQGIIHIEPNQWTINTTNVDAGLTSGISGDSDQVSVSAHDKALQVSATDVTIDGVHVATQTDLNAITASLAAEAATRASADTTLQNNVTAEAVARAAADAAEVTARNLAITTAINNLVNGSPLLLDTLKELADAIGDDPNFAATVAAQIAAEATARGNADAVLQAAITAEAASRVAGDNARLVIANDLSDLHSITTAKTNLGLVAIASSGSAADLTTGLLPAGRFPALTGDVTTVAGFLATTIANLAVTTGKIADGAVTLAKQADMTGGRFRGRKAASGTGPPQDLTPAEALAELSAQAGASFDWNGRKLTNLANGSAASDAATFGQVPVPASNTDASTGTDTAKNITPAALASQRPPETFWMPTGAKAESFTRIGRPLAAWTAVTPSGKMFVTNAVLYEGVVYSSVSFISAAAGSALTHQWFGIYDAAGNKVRITADDTSTAWGANTIKTLNLSSTYTPTATARCYLVYVVTGTPPTILSVPSGGLANAFAPQMQGVSTTLFTDPASAPASLPSLSTNFGFHPYAYVS